MRNAVATARTLWRVLAFGCVAISATVFMLGAHRAPDRRARDVLPLTRTGAGTLFHAVLVLRGDECASRLDFAHVFQRPSRLRVQLERTHTLAAPLPLFDALGLSQAAVLVVYDSARAVRMALALPATVQSANHLVRWIAKPEW